MKTLKFAFEINLPLVSPTNSGFAFDNLPLLTHFWLFEAAYVRGFTKRQIYTFKRNRTENSFSQRLSNYFDDTAQLHNRNVMVNTVIF